MGFASSYLRKHTFFDTFISAEPAPGTSLIVVIPSYNEPDIISSVESLFNARRPSFPVEVIVVVNSPEGSRQEIILQNRKTVARVREWSRNISTGNFQTHVIDVPPFPRKHAGAGFARKAGMDEAIRRFNRLNNKDGIIVSFDADSICDPNYFTELENCFSNKRVKGCTIYFEHPLDGCPGNNSSGAIAEYELYLRYFVQAMRYSGFPYSFHTIGSCFAVRAGVYAAMGGMNRRTAGEDFYFLHKVFPLGGFTELNTTRVVPSSRISDRVPFGTGAAMQKLQGGNYREILSYPVQSFSDLLSLFSSAEMFYGTNRVGIEEVIGRLPVCLGRYLMLNGFAKAAVQMNMNSASRPAFMKRFYSWFSALRLLKYLNFAGNECSERVPVGKSAASLLGLLDIPFSSGEHGLLFKYRQIQRENVWTC